LSDKEIGNPEGYLLSILQELKVSVGEQDFKGYPWRLLEKQEKI